MIQTAYSEILNEKPVQKAQLAYAFLRLINAVRF
jgi:hypothetical protein